MRTYEEVIAQNPNARFMYDCDYVPHGIGYDKNRFSETLGWYTKDGYDIPIVYLVIQTHKAVASGYEDIFKRSNEKININNLWLSLGGKLPEDDWSLPTEQQACNIVECESCQ